MCPRWKTKPPGTSCAPCKPSPAPPPRIPRHEPPAFCLPPRGRPSPGVPPPRQGRYLLSAGTVVRLRSGSIPARLRGREARPRGGGSVNRTILVALGVLLLLVGLGVSFAGWSSGAQPWGQL